MNYGTALCTLKGRTSRRMRGRSTGLKRLSNGEIQLVLHDTAVVTWYPCGAIRLDSGGFRTRTTKDRINAYVPSIRIRTVNRHWVIMTAAHSGRDFEDGMEIDASGRIVDRRTNR